MAAGAPDITGEFEWGLSSGDDNTNGCFQIIYNSADGVNTLLGEGVPFKRYRFDAKNSSSIYGNSDTIQPPAIVLIPQIKY